MTLYTKKEGQYVALTREQVRRLRRNSEVMALQVSSLHLAATTRALAAWMRAIHQRNLKFEPADFVVVRLPNVDRVLSQCDEVSKRVDTLRSS